VFCRQTELVLRQNAGMVPPDFELAELQQDIATLDALRPRLQRLRTLTDRADDTELALGSDILSASLDGYALTKVIGQGTGLDTLKAAMKTRLPASRANPPIPPPERRPRPAPQGGRAVHAGGFARPGKPPVTTSFSTSPRLSRAGRVQTPQHHIWAGRPFPPGLSGYAALTRPTFRAAPPPVAAVLSPWPEARPTRSAADAPRRRPAVALGGSADHHPTGSTGSAADAPFARPPLPAILWSGIGGVCPMPRSPREHKNDAPAYPCDRAGLYLV
jgi:hypothetical protein